MPRSKPSAMLCNHEFNQPAPEALRDMNRSGQHFSRRAESARLCPLPFSNGA
jgi:hypothetical protein